MIQRAYLKHQMWSRLPKEHPPQSSCAALRTGVPPTISVLSHYVCPLWGHAATVALRHFNKLRNQLRKDQTKDIEKEKYDPKRDGWYKDLFHLCEKLGDHIINVSEAITGEKERESKDELLAQWSSSTSDKKWRLNYCTLCKRKCDGSFFVSHTHINPYKGS